MMTPMTAPTPCPFCCEKFLDADSRCTDCNKTAAKATPAPKTPAVGDILSCGWGYDQTRYDFYQVVGVTAKSVRLVEIAKQVVEGGYHGLGGTHAKVVGIKDSFTGTPMTKRVQTWSDTYGVKITSYSTAVLWDGTPKTESGDH